MSFLKHIYFLEGVRDYVREHPDAAAHIGQFSAEGILEARKEDRERASDMEAAVVALTAQRYRGANALVLDKLKKWDGKTSMKFDSIIEHLESMVKK